MLTVCDGNETLQCVKFPARGQDEQMVAVVNKSCFLYAELGVAETGRGGEK